MEKVAGLRSLFLSRKGFIQHHFGNLKSGAGFTLIELLIVIAVLGVLAAVVLVAIDPGQQLARGRDSGRKTSIGQLGRAMQAYYTTQGGYPAGTQWGAGYDVLSSNTLVTTGEMKVFPSNPTYTAAMVQGDGKPDCSPPGIFVPPPYGQDADGTGPGASFCYRIGTAIPVETIIYARLESKSENSRCSGSGSYAWFVWSSANGRAGVVCLPYPPGGIPAAGLQTFLP